MTENQHARIQGLNDLEPPPYSGRDNSSDSSIMEKEAVDKVSAAEKTAPVSRRLGRFDRFLHCFGMQRISKATNPGNRRAIHTKPEVPKAPGFRDRVTAMAEANVQEWGIIREPTLRWYSTGGTACPKCLQVKKGCKVPAPRVPNIKTFNFMITSEHWPVTHQSTSSRADAPWSARLTLYISDVGLELRSPIPWRDHPERCYEDTIKINGGDKSSGKTSFTRILSWGLNSPTESKPHSGQNINRGVQMRFTSPDVHWLVNMSREDLASLINMETAVSVYGCRCLDTAPGDALRIFRTQPIYTKNIKNGDSSLADGTSPETTSGEKNGKPEKWDIDDPEVRRLVSEHFEQHLRGWHK